MLPLLALAATPAISAALKTALVGLAAAATTAALDKHCANQKRNQQNRDTPRKSNHPNRQRD